MYSNGNSGWHIHVLTCTGLPLSKDPAQRVHWGAIIMPILQVRKLRSREAAKFSQCYVSSRWRARIPAHINRPHICALTRWAGAPLPAGKLSCWVDFHTCSFLSPGILRLAHGCPPVPQQQGRASCPLGVLRAATCLGPREGPGLSQLPGGWALSCEPLSFLFTRWISTLWLNCWCWQKN